MPAKSDATAAPEQACGIKLKRCYLQSQNHCPAPVAFGGGKEKQPIAQKGAPTFIQADQDPELASA